MRIDWAEHRQRGFSLVEVMVALLVLSLGLLGVAAMQLKALQSAHAGYQRAVATLAAQDAVELLWSQSSVLLNDDCPYASTATATLVDVDGDAVGEDWEARWKRFLPAIDGSPFTASPSEPALATEECVYTISVSWSESRFASEAAPTFDYTTRLPKGL